MHIFITGATGFVGSAVATTLIRARQSMTSAEKPAPASPPAPAKQGMRNQTVIDLAKAGLSDENIVMAIDAAERTDFDVTPDALISLAKGGVSKSVIAHMQKKSKR